MITPEEYILLQTPALREAVAAARGRDPLEVALDARIPHARLVATQVKYLARAQHKLPSFAAAQCILPPRAFEQASSEACAAHKEISGDAVLDLTCGLGVDTLYLSRRFRHVVALESDPLLARITSDNLARLGVRNVEILALRAEEYLAPLPRLDLAVSTHIHEDHLCGLLRVCRDHPPAVLRQTLPPGFYRSLHPLGDASARNLSERNFLAALDDYRKLCALVEQHGGCIEQSLAGDTLTLAPGLTAEVLAPSGTRAAALTASMQELYRTPQGVPEFREKLDALDASMNNFSLILRLTFGKTRILLPGDTNRAGYGGIPPEKLAADLFKVGHHGQLDGADAALVNAVRPRFSVCCASSDRRYNSAHPDTMRLLKDSGAELYFSDCPPVDGQSIPPHQALEFTICADGAASVRYLP